MEKLKKFLEENKNSKKFIYNFLMVWALIAGPFMWLSIIGMARDLKDARTAFYLTLVSVISGLISWFIVPYWLGIYTLNLLLTMILFSE